MGWEWERDGSESLSPSISGSGMCRIKPSSESIRIAFLRSETPFRTEIGYRGSYRRAVRDRNSEHMQEPVRKKEATRGHEHCNYDPAGSPYLARTPLRPLANGERDGFLAGHESPPDRH